MHKPLLPLLFLTLALSGRIVQADTPAYIDIGGNDNPPIHLFAENGDAGDVYSAQAITGAYQGFAGNLDVDDTADAFLFYFAGGDFGATGLFYPGDPISPEALFFALFYPPDPILPTDPIAPIATADANGLLSVLNLAAGNYIIEAALSPAFDPPFTIQLIGPTTAQPITVTAPTSVPEPATWTLIALGILGWRWGTNRCHNPQAFMTAS
ncbi:PEP-CTERM sorting domain-containing protein [Methylomonas sp. MgM2]